MYPVRYDRDSKWGKLGPCVGEGQVDDGHAVNAA